MEELAIKNAHGNPSEPTRTHWNSTEHGSGITALIRKPEKELGKR